VDDEVMLAALRHDLRDRVAIEDKTAEDKGHGFPSLSPCGVPGIVRCVMQCGYQRRQKRNIPSLPRSSRGRCCDSDP
jgi:hypothetical protein